MVSIQTMEKKPRRIYFVLLALLAFLIPLGIYEVCNKQYLYFALEAVAFALAYRMRYGSNGLFHNRIIPGASDACPRHGRKEVPYDAIGTVEEMSNFLATIYISPKEQYLIHSNHYPGMPKDDTKRTVNILAGEIKKRTGECPYIKHR